MGFQLRGGQYLVQSEIRPAACERIGGGGTPRAVSQSVATTLLAGSSWPTR